MSTTQTPARPAPFSINLLASVLCLCVLVPTLTMASGGGSSAPSIPEPTLTMSPQVLYNQGLKHRDKAWELEKKAAGTDGKAAEKFLKKAEKEFMKAIRAQRSALEIDPNMHQAHSSLGYSLRKVGSYEESIASYDRSLALAPGYTEAIEYRAEAYLGLNRLEEVKEAYLILVREDQTRADELMTAMRRWLDARKDDTEMSASDLDAFASWVEERADIAGHLAMATSSGARDW